MADMVCDICTTPGVGKRIPAERIRQCVALGFNPYKECAGLVSQIQVFQTMGISLDSQYQAWKQGVASDTTDWNVCPKCLMVMERYLKPQAANPADKVAMFKNLISTKGVPCDKCRKTVPVPPSLITEATNAFASGRDWLFKCPECGSTIKIGH